MRALIDCTPLASGGGVQVAIALLANLRAQAETVWQAVMPCSTQAVLPDAWLADRRFSFLPKSTRRDLFWIRTKLTAIEDQFTPDVVFTVFGPSYFRARTSHLVGFALPHLIYDLDPQHVGTARIERLLDRLRCAALRKADHLVVETDTVRERLALRLGIGLAKISVIGNSVNPLLLRYEEPVPAPKDCFKILIPSAYYPHKNLEIAPPVAASMRRLEGAPNFQFRLTLNRESIAWQRIAAEAERLQVADRVVTLGELSLPDLADAYRKASAVFLPTLREASTAVYPESFFFRRPLVTSDLDFARALCGDAAMFVPALDAETIAARLVNLARSPERRERLVEAGTRQLQKNYPDPQTKFAMQLSLMGQVANGGRKRSRAA